MSLERVKSDGERYFIWYAEELLANEYITGYDIDPVTFELFGSRHYEKIKYPLPKKAEPKFVEASLLEKETYSPDFGLYWTEKALGIFFELIEHGIRNKYIPFLVSCKTKEDTVWKTLEPPKDTVAISFIDVKPPSITRFTRVSSSSIYTFPIEQKWVYHKTGWYIQKIIPTGQKTCLFAKSFTPARFMYTDKSGARRNIKHDTPAFMEYVTKQQQEYAKIKKRQDKKTLSINFGLSGRIGSA